MNEQTIQIDIPLLLPEIESEQDDCVNRLMTTIENRRGIHRVHIEKQDETSSLCLHFDPNLISFGSVERLAVEAGTQFTNRYRHQTIPFTGMTTADSSKSLEDLLRPLPGMLHVSVNYAAGLIFAAYDTRILKISVVEKCLNQLGYRVVSPPGVQSKEADHQEVDGHTHAGEFIRLPEWLHDRLTIILITLAGIFLLIGWLGAWQFNLPASAALVFFILSYIMGGYDIATHAIPGLFKGKFDTDVLMLAAAIGAALLGEWAEGAFLLFLFGLGHAGEHYALDRARNAINALGALMPSTAFVKQNDQIVERAVEHVKIDDIVVVRPGDRIPVDGQITDGYSTIDQSAITGESVPVSKQVGDDVFAGTINKENALDVRVTKFAQDNTLSRVIQMVAEAQEQQSPTQQLTQRFTAKFVPAVLIFVALFIVVPPLFGWMTFQESFYRAMLLLVAASPCALAIGTPASVLTGIAQAARNGVLIKGGSHLENLGSLNVMAFDKTGTLTEGKFKVTDVVALEGVEQDELLGIAAAVEQLSNHPLAQAVVEAAQKKSLTLPTADGLENIVGRGVKSEIDGQSILIGSLKLFLEREEIIIDDKIVQLVRGFENAGKTTMIVNQNGRFLGVLALADTPREGARETLQKLLDLGIEKLVMLTGDNAAVAKQIGAEVGVTDIRADLLPEQKLEAIKTLQQKYGEIAMAGDGVNDAPALATATVGIAMGGAGTAVALETADVALMADDLSKLPFVVGLSRASRNNIRQNLIISLGIIALLILSSVLGIVQLSGAVILHEGSTLIVVLNALRLLRYSS